MRKLGLGLGGIVLIAFGWFLHSFFPWSSPSTGNLGDDNQPITIADGQSVDVTTQGAVGAHEVLYTNTYVKSIHLSGNPDTYYCDPDIPGSKNPPCLLVNHQPDPLPVPAPPPGSGVATQNKPGTVEVRNYRRKFLWWGWTGVTVRFTPTVASGWRQGHNDTNDSERDLPGSHIDKSNVFINGQLAKCPNNSGCTVSVCLSTTPATANCP